MAELIASGYGCRAHLGRRTGARAAREQEFGERASLIEADLLDPAGAAEAVAAVDDLEAVVNLVGGFAAGGRVHETDPEEFARMLQLNLDARASTSRARRCRA